MPIRDDEDLVEQTTEHNCPNCENEYTLKYESLDKPNFCPFCSEPLEY